MMNVIVRDEQDGLKNAIKIFNNMVKKSGILSDLKRTEHYEKPSKKRKLKRQEAHNRRIREEKKRIRQQKFKINSML